MYTVQQHFLSAACFAHITVHAVVLWNLGSVPMCRCVQEHEQEAHVMCQQLREQGEAVRALKYELSTSQQEQQQSAEVSLLDHPASCQQ